MNVKLKRGYSLLLIAFLILTISSSTIAFSTHAPNAALQSNEHYATIIEIEPLGGPKSTAVAINNKGQITGIAYTANFQDGSYDRHAYLWDDGVMTDLTPDEGTVSGGLGINDLGQVVGYARARFGSDLHSHPILWTNGISITLDTLVGGTGNAADINNSELIIGNSTSILPNTNSIAVKWENRKISALELPNTTSGAYAVSENGLIAGNVDDPHGVGQAALWKNGILIPLGTLGGTGSSAADVNSRGQVVGHSSLVGNTIQHAYLWEDGSMIDLGVLQGTEHSGALGINKYGVIVGYSYIKPYANAVMWKHGEIIDLNDLLPPTTEWGRLEYAMDINDRGWIVGNGIINGNERGFLLIPPSVVFLPVIISPPPPPVTGNIVINDVLYDGIGIGEPDEFVQIQNNDSHSVQVVDWSLRDDGGTVFTFPDFVIQPGQTCRVYTDEFHPEWCGFNYGSGSAIWNNDGDCAFLRDSTSAPVDTYCYP